MCLIIFVFNIYPLTELNKCVLNPSNRPVVYVIDVLQCGQRTNLADDSGKQTACFFCVVSDDKELVGELREQGLHSFLALAKGMKVGFQSFWLSLYGHSSLMFAVSKRSSCTSAPM